MIEKSVSVRGQYASVMSLLVVATLHSNNSFVLQVVHVSFSKQLRQS